MARVATRGYPGNVRELQNVITRLVALSDGGRISKTALEEPARSVPASSPGSFRQQVESLERALLTQALTVTHGNQSEAARQLGLSRVTFVDKLKRYGLV
jgi:two-component system response regulator AtoC